MHKIFEPTTLGDIAIQNRIIMAPMTRSRANEHDEPTELTVEYYRQRASAGLIVTEGTQPSPTGKGYCRTPGIYSAAQIQAWRAVTDAVHARGGRIVMQLMHCGRIGSRFNKARDAETIAPSPLKARGKIFTATHGMAEFEMPRALTLAEIPLIVSQFATATTNALQAGFDGVELHCASGYLPMQFLCTSTNQRNDNYGGSVINRIRFVLEVLAAMCAVTPGRHVGLRICPGSTYNDISDEDPADTFSKLLTAANTLNLAYVHLLYRPEAHFDPLPLVRASFTGPLILNDGITLAAAKEIISTNRASAVSFGRAFIANPDLVTRFQLEKPLAEFDTSTLYTAGAKGYTDYANAP
jgi:N-ethylmaleimide reductase